MSRFSTFSWCKILVYDVMQSELRWVWKQIIIWLCTTTPSSIVIEIQYHNEDNIFFKILPCTPFPLAVFTVKCTEKGKAQISCVWNCQTLWQLCIFRHCHSYLDRFHKNTLHSHIPQTYISSRIIMSNIISYQTQHLTVTLHPEVNVQFSSISIRLYLYQFSSAAWTQI